MAAIRSLQQWRLTDVELHNFINRWVGSTWKKSDVSHNIAL